MNSTADVDSYGFCSVPLCADLYPPTANNDQNTESAVGSNTLTRVTLKNCFPIMFELQFHYTSVK